MIPNPVDCLRYPFPADENDDHIASIVLSRSQPGLDIVSRVWIEHEGEHYKASALWPPDPLAEYALTVHEDVTRINDAMVRLTGTLSDTLDMEDQAWIDLAQIEIIAIHDARDSFRRAAVPDEAEALRDALSSASIDCNVTADFLETAVLLRDESDFRSHIRVSSCPDTIPQAMARVNEVLDGRGLLP